eukprot:UN16596
MEAGHGGASGRFKRLEDAALNYAFMLDLAGIKNSHTQIQLSNEPRRNVKLRLFLWQIKAKNSAFAYLTLNIYFTVHKL